MFLENSRYYLLPKVEVNLPDGRSVQALTLRRLPRRSGELRTVQDNDQLDHMAHRQYADATKFWHIVDANTALEAKDLVRETGKTLKLPST